SAVRRPTRGRFRPVRRAEERNLIRFDRVPSFPPRLLPPRPVPPPFMNLPEPFIRRPVMTTLVTAAITFFGLLAYRALPVSDLPNIDFPTITVSANLPGASPETMASSVATPLEQQFATIAGIDSMTSTSSLGSTQITLQ